MALAHTALAIKTRSILNPGVPNNPEQLKAQEVDERQDAKLPSKTPGRTTNDPPLAVFLGALVLWRSYSMFIRSTSSRLAAFIRGSNFFLNHPGYVLQPIWQPERPVAQAFDWQLLILKRGFYTDGQHRKT
jgi:hypothetical protein